MRDPIWVVTPIANLKDRVLFPKRDRHVYCQTVYKASAQTLPMDYLYFLANASVTLRTIEYLRNMEHTANACLTVIHQIDGWNVKIRFPQALEPKEHGNLCSFMSELGITYEPEMRLKMVFWSLETGQSPVEVMRRYQVAVVSYGKPDTKDIEAFRQQFTIGLGYCPETLA